MLDENSVTNTKQSLSCSRSVVSRTFWQVLPHWAPSILCNPLASSLLVEVITGRVRNLDYL